MKEEERISQTPHVPCPLGVPKVQIGAFLKNCLPASRSLNPGEEGHFGNENPPVTELKTLFVHGKPSRTALLKTGMGHHI